jgi:hypothetical protein
MSKTYVARRISSEFVLDFESLISAGRYVDRFPKGEYELQTSRTHKVMYVDGFGYVVPLAWDQGRVARWHAELESGVPPEEMLVPDEPSAEQAFKANLLQWLSEEVTAYCDAWPQLVERDVETETKSVRLEDFVQFLVQERLPKHFMDEEGVRLEYELNCRRIWGPWDEKS